MNFDVYAICYNEEILLPYFLRHYSKFCRNIFIYDNMSTDRSPEICSQNPKVTRIQYNSGNQIRDDIYLDIKNNCWKNSDADWVIVCDIDEFVVGSFDPEHCTIVSPDWWEMFSDKIPKGDRQLYEIIDQGVCLGQATKSIMFKPGSLKEINYIPGCHANNAQGDVRLLQTGTVKLLHYKYLTLQYVLDRYALFASRLSEQNRKNGWGFHYEFSREKVEQYYNEIDRKSVV